MYICRFFRLICVLFLIAPLLAYAQGADFAGSGAFALMNAEVGKVEAVHLGSDVSMRIEGLTNRVTVHQRFSNNTQQWMEGVYTFPLPEDSAVNRVRIVLDERELIAVIQEKQEAKRQYEEAKEQGKTAALTEQERPNMFTQSVANIAPGETVDVYIQYLQPVLYDSGVFSIRYPMTITPRFMPGLPQTFLQDDFDTVFQPSRVTGWAIPTRQVPDAERISPHYLSSGQNNSVNIDIMLDAGMPLTQIQSNTHAINVQENAAEQYTHSIVFKEDDIPMDRDFVLQWQPQTDVAPVAASFIEQVAMVDSASEHYVQLMILPPQSLPDGSQSQRELIIVLDTSGSMQGESIRAAKDSVELALQSLKANDYFNLIEFNSDHRELFPQAVQANRNNINRALAFVQSLNADGGTNMQPALLAALVADSPDVEGEVSLVKQVVFITDGSVGNERALFQTIQKNLGKARLFTVGIGSAPNSYFMTQAAESGRGSYIYIADTSQVQTEMGRMFLKLESPVITDIKLEWPGSVAVEQYPVIVSDLYLGEPIVVTAKVQGELPIDAFVRVNGLQAGREWTREIGVVADDADTLPTVLDSGLAATWGRLSIKDLMNGLIEGDSREKVKEQVIEVSIAYQLLSGFTSFLAIEREVSRPSNRGLYASAVPIDAPFGQDFAAQLAGQSQTINVVMPATATGATQNFLIGLLALLLLSSCAVMRKR